MSPSSRPSVELTSMPTAINNFDPEQNDVSGTGISSGAISASDQSDNTDEFGTSVGSGESGGVNSGDIISNSGGSIASGDQSIVHNSTDDGADNEGSDGISGSGNYNDGSSEDIALSSYHPTTSPTVQLSPTGEPSKVPTRVPTAVPTTTPTVAPSSAPTRAPTRVPTRAPTRAPSETAVARTRQPTRANQPSTRAPSKSKFSSSSITLSRSGPEESPSHFSVALLASVLAVFVVAVLVAAMLVRIYRSNGASIGRSLLYPSFHSDDNQLLSPSAAEDIL